MHRDFLTLTIWGLVEDYRLTLIINFGRSYVLVDSGEATTLYRRNVLLTIGAGAGKDMTRTGSCHECEESNEFHLDIFKFKYLKMLKISDVKQV